MFGFFDHVLQFLEMAGTYLTNIATALIKGIGFLGITLQLPFALAGFMPGIIGTAIILTTGILVLRFLLLK